MLFGFMIGSWADRYGRRFVVPMGFFWASVCALFLAWPSTPVISALIITALSVGFDATHPMMSSITTSLDPKHRGQITGLATFANFLGMVCAPAGKIVVFLRCMAEKQHVTFRNGRRGRSLHESSKLSALPILLVFGALSDRTQKRTSLPLALAALRLPASTPAGSVSYPATPQGPAIQLRSPSLFRCVPGWSPES